MTDEIRLRTPQQIADAVECAIGLNVDCGGTEGVHRVRDAVLAAIQPALGRLAEYENTINWMTTCTSCARVLDSSIRETERAERAEAAIARIRDAATLHRQGLLSTAELYAVIEAAGHPEKALADALGGHRAAQVIAHTLYCHGYTLSAVQRMTDAELRAVPGIGDTSLATIRNALGQPGPAAGGCSAPIPRTEPNNTGRAAAEATEPVRCPCDGTHFPSPENCRWCKCHRAWTPPPPGDRREQLPDHILDLIRPYLRGYTSTACQTAGYLAEAIADQAEHRAELAVWRARMKARCRDNQKYTGEICPNHTVPGRS